VVISARRTLGAKIPGAYDSEVQFLANRGYAVLQMNFRVPLGTGEVWEASFKQWGKTMQDDITDGVQWLTKQGVADPKKVAIYGGSYGGLRHPRGVTFTPDLYAARSITVGGFQFVYVYENDPALLETVSRHVS